MLNYTPKCNITGFPRPPIFHGDYSFNNERKKTLSGMDTDILMYTLGVSLTIGLATLWRQRTNKNIYEYILLSRSLYGPLASMSIGASFLSSVTIISMSGTVYLQNIMEVWMLLPLIMATSLATSVTVPIFYKLELTSAYEYLEYRFNRTVRLLGYLWFLIYSLVNGSLVLYSPSLIVHSVCGISPIKATLVVGSVCILYTLMGCTRGVVYADIVHLFIMFLGIIIVLMKAREIVGGPSTVWDSGRRSKRIMFDNFSIDPSDSNSVWPIMFGYFHYYTYMFGVHQPSIHRCLSCRSLRNAKIALWLNVILMWVFLVMCIVLALYASAFYENCDPLKAQLLDNRYDVVPFFILDTMHGDTGHVGAYFAVIMCATLSTFSTLLNTTAMSTLEDLAKIWKNREIKRSSARRVVQITTVVLGGACITGTVIFSEYEGDFYVLVTSMSWSILSSILAVFFMGLFLPIINSIGAMCGLIAGLNISLVLFAWHKEDDNSPTAERCVSNCNTTIITVYDPSTKDYPDLLVSLAGRMSDHNFFETLSYRYYGLLSSIAAIIVGLLVSWISGFQEPRKLRRILIVPFFDEVFPFYYLPESFRKKCRFGIDHTGKWEQWDLSRGVVRSQYSETFCRPKVRTTLGTESEEELTPEADPSAVTSILAAETPDVSYDSQVDPMEFTNMHRIKTKGELSSQAIPTAPTSMRKVDSKTRRTLQAITTAAAIMRKVDTMPKPTLQGIPTTPASMRKVETNAETAVPAVPGEVTGTQIVSTKAKSTPPAVPKTATSTNVDGSDDSDDSFVEENIWTAVIKMLREK